MGCEGLFPSLSKTSLNGEGGEEVGSSPQKLKKKRVIDEGGKTDKKEEPDLSRGRDDMVTFSSG
jgi:hypothetical protein